MCYLLCVFFGGLRNGLPYDQLTSEDNWKWTVKTRSPGNERDKMPRSFQSTCM